MNSVLCIKKSRVSPQNPFQKCILSASSSSSWLWSFHFPALLPQLLRWDVPCPDPVCAGRRAVRSTLPRPFSPQLCQTTTTLALFSPFVWTDPTQWDHVPPPHERHRAEFCCSPCLVVRQKARFCEAAACRRALQGPDAMTGQGCGCRPSICPPFQIPLRKKTRTPCLLPSGAKMLFKNEKDILPKTNREAVKEGAQRSELGSLPGEHPRWENAGRRAFPWGRRRWGGLRTMVLREEGPLRKVYVGSWCYPSCPLAMRKINPFPCLEKLRLLSTHQGWHKISP